MSPVEPHLPRAVIEGDPEATAAFPSRVQLSSSPRRIGVASGTGDGTVIEPPRGSGELGWLAHYRVLRLIGEGAMGLVYQAEDTHLGRLVALKLIRPELANTPEAAQRFAREARAAAAIKHDHIVTIYQVGQHGDVAFLAMEYLEGVSLHRWLERGRKPSVDLILRIAREVASGLAAAHSLGLVHRDIKPANIWLESPHGRVKILDFGHARAAREDDATITQAGRIMGTPAFMAPEQARGEPVNASCDLFSLGCVLYRLCSGRLPFQGETIMAVLTALAADVPPSTRDFEPNIPVPLDDLVMQLLAKDAAARPASAQAVIDAIRLIERGLATDRQMAEFGSTTLKNLDISPANPVESLVIHAKKTGIAHRSRWLAAAALSLIAIPVVWFSAPFLYRHPKTRETPSVAPIDPESNNPPLVVIAPMPQPLPQEPAVSPKPSEAPIPVVEAEIPATPGPDVPAVPAAPRSPGVQGMTAADWGVVIDPDGDCKVALDLDRRRAEIDVPGKPHILSADLGRVNAPRILRSIQGDFEIGVQVTGTDHPSGRATTTNYTPYHGAGLLIWQDAENYVRLEVAAEIRKGKPFRYANFEYRKDGRLESSQGLKFDNQAVYVRLQRRGNVVYAAFSPDGLRWTSFPRLDVDLKETLQVGVAAINTATKPLKAILEDFRVTVTRPVEIP